MNTEQLSSLLRTFLQVGGAYVVGRGWASADTVASVGGAILTLVVTAWGLYARRNAGLIAAAASVPEVRTITTDAKTASAVTSGKVQAGV